MSKPVVTRRRMGRLIGDGTLGRYLGGPDGGIGGAAVLEGAEVGGDDFRCPPLGAGVGHPGGEVGQIRAKEDPRLISYSSDTT